MLSPYVQANWRPPVMMPSGIGFSFLHTLFGISTQLICVHACRWIQDQYANHRAEFWRNGLEEYLQYGREIQAKFPVTADLQADAPSTSTAGKEHLYMLTFSLASGDDRHDACS